MRHQAAVVSLGQQISELKKRLGDIGGDKIERIRSSLYDTRSRTQRLIGERVLQLQKVPGLEKELGDKRRRIRQVERTVKRNQALRRRERLAENCLRALTLTYENVREIERRKISERTQENFFRMNVRKDEFERVDVTPSFRLEVIAPGGQVVNSVLSGAQRRALSLSFLFALMQVSERDAPVVVDTPLGMTSGPMRRSIAEAMIDQTNQLVLLLTRSEIEGVQDILRVGAAGMVTLTCSHDYPEELANPPRLEGAYTEVCKCGIDQQCEICERLPVRETAAVSGDG